MGIGESVFRRLYGNKEVRVVMLGLEEAGKTTMLYKMKLGEVVSTIPTIDVFIFMVDSNDRGRISESQDELQRAMAENELRDSILLVLANKQDLPNAMSVQEITEKLGLNNLKDRLWHIQSSCATSGDGLYDGLEWVQDTLSKREVKKTLTQPLTETAKSASGTTSKPSLLSTWVSSIGGYLQGKTVITA